MPPRDKTLISWELKSIRNILPIDFAEPFYEGSRFKVFGKWVQAKKPRAI
jgi:hypothetical protein